MQCEGFTPDLYSDYVLGTLDASGLADVDSHLNRDCIRCQSELRLSRSVWYGVALASPAAEPRRGLRQRIINSVQSPEASGLRLLGWQPIAGFAALALAVLAGWQIGGTRFFPTPMVQVLPAPKANGPEISALARENRSLRDRLASRQTVPSVPVTPRPTPDVAAGAQQNSALLAQLAQAREQVSRAEQELNAQKVLSASADRAREDAERRVQAAVAEAKLAQPGTTNLQRQLASAQGRAQQLERDVAEYKALLATARQRLAPLQTASLMADPNLRLVRLRGTASASGAEGHALISNSQVVFYGSQLPPLPAGRAYQLWLIRRSSPAIVSAGVFQPNTGRQATVQFSNAALTSGITTLAVTDEPESGSVAPTGHKLLIGS